MTLRVFQEENVSFDRDGRYAIPDAAMDLASTPPGFTQQVSAYFPISSMVIPQGVHRSPLKPYQHSPAKVGGNNCALRVLQIARCDSDFPGLGTDSFNSRKVAFTQRRVDYFSKIKHERLLRALSGWATPIRQRK